MNLSEINEIAKGNCAVLVSGGFDSAILLGHLLSVSKFDVHPVFIRCGMAWEEIELRYLDKFLASLRGKNLMPLKILDLPIKDLYGEHWSINGLGVPGEETPDEAVFLPGRNVILSAKALLWCHLNSIDSLAMGILGANPFPDASKSFFKKMSDAVNTGIQGGVKIFTPYASLSKKDVGILGKELALEHTFSCINPVNSLHCGKCNKCAERKKGFVAAGITDKTSYFGE